MAFRDTELKDLTAQGMVPPLWTLFFFPSLLFFFCWWIRSVLKRVFGRRVRFPLLLVISREPETARPVFPPFPPKMRFTVRQYLYVQM